MLCKGHKLWLVSEQIWLRVLASFCGSCVISCKPWTSSVPWGTRNAGSTQQFLVNKTKPTLSITTLLPAQLPSQLCFSCQWAKVRAPRTQKEQQTLKRQRRQGKATEREHSLEQSLDQTFLKLTCNFWHANLHKGLVYLKSWGMAKFRSPLHSGGSYHLPILCLFSLKSLFPSLQIGIILFFSI